MHHNLFSRPSPRGFTLVELVVVMGIITVITTIALANNSRFNGTIFLSNLAYDVALSIREAQVYGLSVKELRSAGATTFDVGYGVTFSLSSPSSYILFTDTNSDHVYESGVDVIEESISFKNGYEIADLCATRSGTESCGLATLTIAFERPDPDASILSGGTAYDSARIVIESQDGESRSVSAFSTGQISVGE